jgi:hypothetical protein
MYVLCVYIYIRDWYTYQTMIEQFEWYNSLYNILKQEYTRPAYHLSKTF